MNYVSYTRVVSDTYAKVNETGSSGCGIPKMPEKISIHEQNEKINAFVKANGLTIIKRYTDRKESRDADEAFKQLREDVVNRKVDCLIINSVYYCGPSISAAKDLLKCVLFPAGIPFIVIEDNFYSEKKSYEDVDKYFKEKVNMMRSMMSMRIACSWYENKRYSKYGYVWVSDNEYEIDPEAAEVVRLAFNLTKQGMTAKAIADYLNINHYEGENVYRRRKNGLAIKRNTTWSESQINHLLKDTSYIGFFDKTIGKRKVARTCPKIIDDRLFSEVQKIIEERTIGVSEKRPNYNPFKYRIFDKDTDTQLIIYSERQGTIFRFPSPAPITDYPKKSILYSEVEMAFRQMLRTQKQMAKIAADKINSDVGRAVYERRKELLLAPCKKTFAKLCSIEADCRESNLEDFINTNKEFNSYYDNFEYLGEVFSNENKWLKRFQNAELEKEVSFETVKQYTEKVYVSRFETVTVIPVFKDWFDQLPIEWFMQEE